MGSDRPSRDGLLASSSPDSTQIVRPPSLQEMVLLGVRKLLLTGELAPGDRVRIGDLADQFGVSPVPVREAIMVLESEGLITKSGGRGYWVKSLSVAEVDEILLLASLLEHEVLRRGVPSMRDSEIATMERLFDSLTATDVGDTWSEAMIHREFHFVPYRAAGLTRVVDELMRYWEHTDHYRVIYLFTDEEVTDESVEQHRQILEACRRRDAEDAIRAMDAHRSYAAAKMREQLEAGGPSGRPPTPTTLD